MWNCQRAKVGPVIRNAIVVPDLANGIFIFMGFALLLAACDGQPPGLVTHELSGQTMGTSFSIELVASDDDIDETRLEQRVVEILNRVDQRMSTWLPDSELSLFNGNSSTDWINVSAELCRVVEAALGMSERDGWGLRHYGGTARQSVGIRS